MTFDPNTLSVDDRKKYDRYRETIDDFEELKAIGGPLYMEAERSDRRGKMYVTTSPPFFAVSVDDRGNVYFDVEDPTQADGADLLASAGEDELWNREYLELRSVSTYMAARRQAKNARETLRRRGWV